MAAVVAGTFEFFLQIKLVWIFSLFGLLLILKWGGLLRMRNFQEAH